MFFRSFEHCHTQYTWLQAAHVYIECRWLITEWCLYVFRLHPTHESKNKKQKQEQKPWNAFSWRNFYCSPIANHFTFRMFHFAIFLFTFIFEWYRTIPLNHTLSICFFFRFSSFLNHVSFNQLHNVVGARISYWK